MVFTLRIPKFSETPLLIGAGARYPYDEGIAKKLTFKDRFGEQYKLYKHEVEHGSILVPRNCATSSTNSTYSLSNKDNCKSYEWSNYFAPRSDEQVRVVAESVGLLTSNPMQGFVMQAPTGFGKTWCGAAIISNFKVRTCIITTKEDLRKEWTDALSTVLGIPKEAIGVWSGDKVPKPEHQVVVATVQSVCKGYERYPEEMYRSFGFVMLDEVHRMGATEFSQAMWYFPAVYRMGLSATPERMDGRERVFQAHIGDVEVSTEEMNLVPKVIMYDTHWEVPMVHQWDKEANDGAGAMVFGPLKLEWGKVIVASKHLMKDKTRTGIIVRFMQTCFKKGRKVVIMSDTTDYLKEIHRMAVEEGGIPDTYENFGYYCGLSADVYEKVSAGRKINKEAQREAAKLAVFTLATYKMCGEGTNVPWWDTEVLVTPKANVKQPVGRILREWPGKHHPLVLHLCDNNHEVMRVFAGKCRKWYESIGAKIINM